MWILFNFFGLPLKWVHAHQEIGDGANLDLLLSSTSNFALSVNTVITTVAITVFSPNSVTKY